MTLWFKLVLLVWGFKLESSRSNSIFHSWKPQGLRLQKCKRNNLRRKNKIHSHKSKQTSPTLAHPRSKKKPQSFLTRTPPPPPPCVYISIYIIILYVISYIIHHGFVRSGDFQMISYSGISDSEPDGGATFCSNVHKTHGPWVAANVIPSWIIAARGTHRSRMASAILVCCMPFLLLIVFAWSPRIMLLRWVSFHLGLPSRRLNRCKPRAHGPGMPHLNKFQKLTSGRTSSKRTSDDISGSQPKMFAAWPVRKQSFSFILRRKLNGQMQKDSSISESYDLVTSDTRVGFGLMIIIADKHSTTYHHDLSAMLL